MYREVRLEDPRRCMADDTYDHGHRLVFATINVKSLFKRTMHMQVEGYMAERGVSVLCLQETMVATSTQYVVGDLLYVLCGHGGDDREYAGVGFVFTKEARRHITGFELYQDGRLMVVGLNMAPRMLSLVTVYAPQSRRPEEERTGFFEELSKVVARCAKRGAVMVMGDCNARIHGRRHTETGILAPTRGVGAWRR